MQFQQTPDGAWTDLGTTSDHSYATSVTAEDRFYRIVDAFN